MEMFAQKIFIWKCFHNGLPAKQKFWTEIIIVLNLRFVIYVWLNQRILSTCCSLGYMLGPSNLSLGLNWNDDITNQWNFYAFDQKYWNYDRIFSWWCDIGDIVFNSLSLDSFNLMLTMRWKFWLYHHKENDL